MDEKSLFIAKELLQNSVSVTSNQELGSDFTL